MNGSIPRIGTIIAAGGMHGFEYEQEGPAIFSVYPIVHHEYILLDRNAALAGKIHWPA